MYKRHAVGDFHVGVCTNTLCAVMGGDEIFARLKEHLDIGNDEVAEKRQGDQYSVSLEHVECNAACDYAPVVMVNWEFMDNQTPEGAVQMVESLRAGHDVRSTRGPAPLHLARGRAGARRLPRRPRRRGPGRRAGQPGRARDRAERGWTAPAARRGRGRGSGQAGRRRRRRHARAESETVERPAAP